MSDDRVKELAKESDHVKARREDLKKETAKLKEALKYCNRHKPRTLICEYTQDRLSAQLLRLTRTFFSSQLKREKSQQQRRRRRLAREATPR